jgi:RluA family pseudouridine synthase
MPASHADSRPVPPPIMNIAGYRFLPLSDLKPLRARLQRQCEEWELKGTILLSPEGINLFVAGTPEKVEQLLAQLRSLSGLETLQVKVSETDHQPFRRMLVRIKKEIIAFGVEGIDPARRTSPKLAPRELKRWLDEGRPITLLDTRNDYEVKLGTFRNALPIGIDQFRDFPQAVAKLAPELKQQPIVMFCTGGIRCEKAGPFMEREGFQNVFQLDGGILKYFEECGGEHYDGECFVFVGRVGVDASLRETESCQCFNCQSPLTQAEQQHEHYVEGRSCPYCFKTETEQIEARIARRHEQIRQLAAALPGSQPRDQFKPVHVPAQCDGKTLLEALCRVAALFPADVWQQRCDEGRVLDETGQPARASQTVRAGERFRHKLPAVIEPDVNMHVGVLHEDEALIVLNKPAPLPMHAGGRFYNNTLQYVLDSVYYPQKPRPSHRLDANTTGVLVVARTRHFAGQVQPQFARGAVEKVYLARVQGQPTADEFTCDAPISDIAGALGSRIVDPTSGLPARTDFRVLERFADDTTLLEARPLTGRTNQIRVHLWHLGFPVCGDPTYWPGGKLGDTQTLAINAPPLCLHASRITLMHPLTREKAQFAAPIPPWAAKSISTNLLPSTSAGNSSFSAPTR